MEINEGDNELTFETDRTGWQMIGENSSFANDVNLTINPLGYGSIPHDMRVFVAFTESNVVLSPFSYDISKILDTIYNKISNLKDTIKARVSVDLAFIISSLVLINFDVLIL